MDMTPFYLAARPRHGIASLTFLLLSAIHLHVSNSLPVTISDDHQHEGGSIQRVAREVSSTSPPCSGDRSIDIYEDYCVPDSATSVLIRRIDCGTGVEIQVFPANDPNKEREPVIIGDEYGVSLYNPGRFAGTSYFRCIARPLAAGGRYGEATFIVKPNSFLQGLCDIVSNGGCSPFPTTTAQQRSTSMPPPIETPLFATTVHSRVTTPPHDRTTELSKSVSTTNVGQPTSSSEAPQAGVATPSVISTSTNGQGSSTGGMSQVDNIIIIVSCSSACFVLGIVILVIHRRSQKALESAGYKPPPVTDFKEEAQSIRGGVQGDHESNTTAVSSRSSPEPTPPLLGQPTTPPLLDQPTTPPLLDQPTTPHLSPEARVTVARTTEAGPVFTSVTEVVSVQERSGVETSVSRTAQHPPHGERSQRALEEGVHNIDGIGQQDPSELVAHCSSPFVLDSSPNDNTAPKSIHRRNSLPPQYFANQKLEEARLADTPV